jgi:hypothetical protein
MTINIPPLLIPRLRLAKDDVLVELVVASSSPA